MQRKNKLTIFIWKSINIAIMFACLFYVSFETYNCFKKYFDKPQATSINGGPSKNFIQPDVTLCVAETEVWARNYYNKSVLDQCDIE